MIQWVVNVDHEISMEQGEGLWNKILKLTLNVNLKEN